MFNDYSIGNEIKANWEECDYIVLEHGFIERYKDLAVKCTNCKHAFKKEYLLCRNFCPNCGADMRGETNDS